MTFPFTSWPVALALGFDADIVVVEDDVRGVVDEHAAGVEAVDGQGLDLRARGGDVQPERRAARVVADELDERVGAVVAPLGGPVDDHRLGDRRQLATGAGSARR